MRWYADDEALSPLHTLNYHYDLAGRLVSASDTVAEYDYAYDRLDQVTSLTTNLAGLADEVVMTSVYDLTGNRTKLSTTIDAVADLVNDYVYDDLNRLKQIKQHGTSGGNAVAQKRADFSYHLDGQFDQIKRYDDLAATVGVIDTTYDYDLAGRVTSVWHLKSVNLFFSHGREYDQANRAVHDTTYYSTGSATTLERYYNYDERGQLTSVTDSEETLTVYEDYVYDDNGNREESDGNPWDIDPNNQLRSDGVYQYEYDEEGNRTRRIELVDDEPEGETTEYVWDHRNRLTAVITRATPAPEAPAIHTVIYAYDVFDRKVRRDVDETGDGTSVDSRELYVYDGANVLFDFEDEDANGGDPQVLARRYLHGPAVDQVLAQEEVGDDTDWLLADLQGSTRDIVRHNGTTTVLVEHLDYNSFGEPVIASAVTRYGYTAREYDTDTGLQYNRARWYSVTAATWMSEDPDGFRPGDPNLMRYVGNSPTNASDPSGNDAEWWNDCSWFNVGSYPLLRDAINYFAGYYDAAGESKALDAKREAEDPNKPPQAGDFPTALTGESQLAAAGTAEAEIEEFGRERILDVACIAIGPVTKSAGQLVKELSLAEDFQRTLLRFAMGGRRVGKVAHHLIPLEAFTKYKDLITRAAKGGFDINGCNNGIWLVRAEHIGGHPKYNAAVLEQLGQIAKNAAQMSDPELATAVQKAADTLKAAIKAGTYGPWE